MPSAFDWNRELSWIKEYRFPLDQGNQTVYECLKNWMDDYNRRIMTTTFMISEEKEQIKFFSDRLMQASKSTGDFKTGAESQNQELR
ncbi:MAG: hypothetical protein KH315_00600 [Faecalibacterium prausnitzii]|uniref:Uncharacterized protein n=1 Tax=Faecalibacterium prausnitzii TaxID=853 RepID=A0A9E1DNV0_9FIRM|nr:hypothetical protein [Faecalibacterium prausnitzii]